MGRFATTVPLYANFRSPYAAGFFETVARRAGLGKADSLIDLGTGPGIIALGFAAYVGRIVGVDPEPAMLEAARQAAARTSQAFTLVESKAETLTADVGSYNVVTIGRALHWLAPEATAALFARLVAPGGVILVCASASAADGRNAWLAAYNEARRSWSHSAEGERHHHDLDTLLRGTRFQVGEPITVESRHQISVSDLARRVLTFSSSSPTKCSATSRTGFSLWAKPASLRRSYYRRRGLRGNGDRKSKAPRNGWILLSRCVRPDRGRTATRGTTVPCAPCAGPSGARTRLARGRSRGAGASRVHSALLGECPLKVFVPCAS